MARIKSPPRLDRIAHIARIKIHDIARLKAAVEVQRRTAIAPGLLDSIRAMSRPDGAEADVPCEITHVQRRPHAGAAVESTPVPRLRFAPRL
ncbi:MAG TPA: hypothetical protein VF210_16845 [Pseudomonadales bacterium]